MKKEQKTQLNEVDLKVLGCVVDNQVAFSQQIAHGLIVWFTDVEESLSKLEEEGLVTKHESELGLSGYMFCPTEKAAEFMGR